MHGYVGTAAPWQARGHEPIPPGLIAMWSGSAAAIPSGWFLCDGLNGTPDLQGQFIVGATSLNIGETGGSNTKTLTSANLPAHTHDVGSAVATSGNQSASHTHSATSGNQSVSHTHSGTTGGYSADHSHGGTSGTVSADHSHWYQTSGWYSPNYCGSGSGTSSFRNPGNTGGISANHTHWTTTGGQSAGHTHSVTTGNQSASHTHSVVTGNQSASHTHTVTVPAATSGSTGTGTAFDIRPAYFALAFIMKGA